MILPTDGDIIVTLERALLATENSYYALLLENIILFCQFRESPVSKKKTLAIIHFIEQANKDIQNSKGGDPISIKVIGSKCSATRWS